MKKRILILNYEFPPLGGGASPVSYELAKRMSETGDFDIDVVTMHYKGLSKYEEVNKNFRIHRVRCLRSKKEICHPWEQATYLISGYLKCRELLSKNKYYLCHCHFIIPTGVLALKLKKEFGLEYIITAHGSDVLGYNKRFKMLYPFLVGTWKSVLDNSKKIISPSNFLKNEVLKVYKSFNPENIKVIPNGIDINKFSPQEKKKYIFSSGRLFSNKGFQYLIQAVSNEDIGYEVHIAGDGPMMPELKELASKSKTKVVLHGWLDNNGRKYKDLLEQSAIYVLASEKENASIALLEGMSAGCAMITTNISGCAETVGESGVVIDPRSPDQIRKAINNISKEVDHFSDMALVRVNSVYSWEKILNMYLEEYE